MAMQFENQVPYYWFETIKQCLVVVGPDEGMLCSHYPAFSLVGLQSIKAPNSSVRSERCNFLNTPNDIEIIRHYLPCLLAVADGAD